MSPGHRFDLVDGHLCKVEIATGTVLARHFPLGTSIVQVLPNGPNLVVREDYYKFPQGESNLYCLNEYFDLVWRAELPYVKDIYANPVTVTPAGLHCATWDCMSCTLDPATGRITKKVFTK